jgi:hypothetical protein
MDHPITNMADVLPPGNYYVGDLCYVFDDKRWDQMCDAMGHKDCTIETDNDADCYKMPDDGMVFYMLRTDADGTYEDTDGYSYPVDSASLGCVHEKYIQRMAKCGRIIEFPEPFTCSIDDEGSFSFGGLVVFDFSSEKNNDCDSACGCEDDCSCEGECGYEEEDDDEEE